MSTCDAQALATRFLGDTIGANILMLGYAWQLGLVPVSFAAMMRAIELNNVAVAMNQLAFSIGRLAAEDPAALEALWQARHLAKQTVLVDTLDELVAHREGRLQIYGGAAYVKRYRALVDAVAYGTITVGHPFLEGAAAPALDNNLSIARLPFDGNDTASNHADFVLQDAPTPRTTNAP